MILYMKHCIKEKMNKLFGVWALLLICWFAEWWKNVCGPYFAYILIFLILKNKSL